MTDFAFDPTRIFVAGAWRPPQAVDTLPIFDPSTGEETGRLAKGSAADIDAAVGAAREAADGAWGRMTALERGRALARMGHAVSERTEALAHMEALDVGKPLAQARADAIALARYLEFYAGACDKIHGDTIPYQDGYSVMTWREPHGVTGHIIPWNYPMQIIGRSVGAALAMGNACVVKPAEEAAMTALAFAEIAEAAGLPPGGLNVVPGLGEEAGAALAAHPGVDHVSFTGSGPVGAKVQRAAGGHTAPVTLELGGKSPQIVFADADLDAALPFLVRAGLQNAGQTCSAASRILIERTIFEDLTERLAAAYAPLTAGPAVQDLDLGPLVSARQKEIVEGYLAKAAASGLSPVAEGRIAEDAPEGGCYVLPTFFANVAPDHVLAQEEIFGPVQVAIPFDGEADALAIANGTPYGLVAGVWTRDGGRALRCARALKSGQVFINNYGAGGGVELPFGGVKASGHGREKGFEALYGFSTVKTVAVHHG